MRYSEKELRKQALKLTTVGKSQPLRAVIIFLIGILCVAYLVSSGRNFIRSMIELRQMELSKIRVEVLNGTEIKGLAEETSEFLRKKGFDVVRYENAETKVPETVIIDRADSELKNARVVRNVLKQGKLSFEPQSLQFLEVTVVIGKDFKAKKKASISAIRQRRIGGIE